MKITKGKVILFVIVVYFTVFAIINVNKEKNVNEDILSKVVYVSDGTVKEENDGKIVLVVGKISAENRVGFLELNEGFSALKISRKVEDYIKDEDGDLQWTERTEPLLNAKDDEYINTLVSMEKIADKIMVGDFVLDETGREKLPLDTYYDKQESIGKLTTTGTFYSRDPWAEDLVEGDTKHTYKYFDDNNNPIISILAVQNGNTLKPYEVDSKTKVYQIFKAVVDDKDKLQEQLNLNVKRTIKGKTLFIIMILGVGIFFIVDAAKSKKEVDNK